MVRYQWHPDFGRDVVIRYRERRRGEQVFVCVGANDTSEVIPAWMFDAAVCANQKLDVPQVNLAALEDLRGLLSALASDPAVTTKQVSTRETPHEKQQTNGYHQTGVAPDCVATSGKYTQDTEQREPHGDSCRIGATTSSSRRPSDRKRGRR